LTTGPLPLQLQAVNLYAADFKGLKVRTMENQLMIKTFNMMGAAATRFLSAKFIRSPAGVIDASKAGSGILGYEAQ